MQTLNTLRSFKALLSGLMAVLLVAALSLPLGICPQQAYAVTSAEKQAEADEITQRIDSLQTQLNAANAEYDRASDEYNAALDAAAEAAEREKAAQERIAEIQGQLSVRAVQLYKSGGNATFIDVILGSSSFTEFTTLYDSYNRFFEQDQALVDESREAREEAEAARQEYEEQSEKAAEEMAAAQAAQEEISATKASMEEELQRVNEEVIALQIQEEEQRMEEEAARKREEEAAAAAAAAQAAAAQNSYTSSSSSSSANATASSVGWINPCPQGYVSSEFGWRPAFNAFHTGIDLAADSGSPIYAAASGTVSYVGWYGSGGQAVIVTHGNGVRSIYMHMSAYNAYQGQQVSAGDVIGYVGSTGHSTGPHLHFTIEINGSAVNPRSYVNF